MKIPRMSEEVKQVLLRLIRQELHEMMNPSAADQQPKRLTEAWAVISEKYLRAMHPADARLIVKLLRIEREAKPSKPLFGTPKEFNEEQPGGQKMPDPDLNDQPDIDRVLEKHKIKPRIKISQSRKRHPRKTLTDNELLSEEMRFWPPLMDNRELRDWIRRVIREWHRVGADSYSKDQYGVTHMPSYYQRTAALEVYLVKESLEVARYHVDVLFDKLHQFGFTVWSRYKDEFQLDYQGDKIPLPDLVVNEVSKPSTARPGELFVYRKVTKFLNFYITHKRLREFKKPS